MTFLKGTKDITKSDRVSKEVSDDYTRFTVQSSQIADSGTYFVVARNNFGTDRIFVTVAVSHKTLKSLLLANASFLVTDELINEFNSVKNYEEQEQTSYYIYTPPYIYQLAHVADEAVDFWK